MPESVKVEDAAGKLREALAAMPRKLNEKVTRTVLRQALAAMNVREELRAAIESRFGKYEHTGRMRRAVVLKTSRVRTEEGRMVAYVGFKKMPEIKASKNSRWNKPQPRTVAYWLENGTRDHSVSSGARAGGIDDARAWFQQRLEDAFERFEKLEEQQARSTPAAASRLEYKVERADSAIHYWKDRLRALETREKGQKERPVKGIDASFFIREIRKRAEAEGPRIIFAEMEKLVSEYIDKEVNHGI